MAEYKYLFSDLLTNAPLAELPCFGTYFEKFVNATGNATASVKIGQGGYEDTALDDQLILEATQPGRTALYVDRNGKLIWGGIVWSRTYQSQAKTLSMTAQTFDSMLFKRVCRRNLDYSHTSDEQRNIVIDLISKMQSDGTGTNIGLINPPSFGVSKQRDLHVHDYDLSTYGDLIAGIYNLADGFDFLIDVAYQNDAPAKFVLMGYPNLGDPVGLPNVALEYPGTIFNYYFPESVGSSREWAAGSGDGAHKLVASATASDLLSGGYPLVEEVDSGHSDVTVQDTLQGWADTNLAVNRIPMTVPTIDMNPDEPPGIENIQVGQYMQLVINDPRFPNGYSKAIRITGWKLTPQQSGNVDQVSLAVNGAN
jgi:hypothetical protein